jgi:acyl-CoA hydrolase
MATSDRVEFHEPIHVGELVELVAHIVRVGHSSMTVAVDMIREHLISGARISAVRGTFEMVAVNECGRPVPIARPAMTDPIQKEAAS